MKRFGAILILLTTFNVGAAKSENEENLKKSQETQLIEKLKIARLEEQNKILLNTTNDLRNSYYWALGYSATFLLIFLGLNIYSSNRRFDDEKINLEKIMENKVEEELLNLNKENEKSKSLILNELRSTLEQRKVETEEKLSELTNLIKEQKLGSERRIKEISLSHKKEVLSAEIERKELEFKIFILKDIKSTTVRIAAEICSLSQDLNKLQNGNYQNWRIGKYLSEIEKLINQTVKNDRHTVQEVVNIMPKLDSEFEVYKSRILEKLK